MSTQYQPFNTLGNPPDYILLNEEEIGSSRDRRNINNLHNRFNKKSKLKDIGFNIKFLTRFYKLLRLGSGSKSTFIKNSSILLLVAILKEIAAYYTGKITSHFYVVLNKQDFDGFKILIFQSLIIVLTTASLMALLKYFQGYIAWLFRKNLTIDIHAKYFQKGSFYKLNHKKLIDNPDQRITQDIDNFTRKFGICLITVLLSPFLIIYYTVKLWSYSGYFGPLVIYSYFIISTLVSKALVPRVAKKVFMTEVYEGKFRSEHIHVLKHHEEVSLLNGETREGLSLTDTLKDLLKMQKKVVNRGFIVYLNENIFAYFGSILSYIIIATPIFAGVYKNKDSGELSGIISMVAFISMSLVYQFTLLVEQSTPISNIIGYTTRISQLYETIETISTDLEDTHYQNECMSEFFCITLSNISLLSPDDKPIFKDFTMTIRQMEHVLITGSNGSGKSSLVRLLSGLWMPNSGEIKWPLDSAEANLISFCPAKSHFIHGSLRDQIIYPDKVDDINLVLSDDRVYELLNQVGLDDLVIKLNGMDIIYTAEEWYKILTPGQQQKLSLTRIFFQRPIFAVLDEATAFIDHLSETKILDMLDQNGITIIFITQHNPSLVLNAPSNHDLHTMPHFSQHLQLSSKGEEPIISHA